MFTSHPFCFRINCQIIEMLFLTALSLCVCALNAMAFPYWTHIFHGRTFFCSIAGLFGSIYIYICFCATHSLILLFLVCFFFSSLLSMCMCVCACLSFYTLTLFLFFQFVCTHIKIHSLVHAHTRARWARVKGSWKFSDITKIYKKLKYTLWIDKLALTILTNCDGS